MPNTKWAETKLPEESAGMVWEQFHENAKLGRYDVALPQERVASEMSRLHASLPYRNTERIALPDTLAAIERGFAETVLGRSTPPEIRSASMTLVQLRTILHFAYGVTRDNHARPHIGRGFRAVPSGGALYPLELYLYHAGSVEGLPAGLYHYSPEVNALHSIKPGNLDTVLAQALVEFQKDVAANFSVTIFITALFARSIFKYRDRGYRFALLEAGHVAQNINLTAGALGFGAMNLGGFYDRLVDEMLGLDGLNHSIVYLNGLCAGRYEDARHVA